MKRWRRAFVVVMLAVAALSAVGQMRILPTRLLDSVANPRVVEASPLRFIGGDSLSLGSIDERGGVWRREVRWRNEGDEPMVITHIRSSCGCLRAEYGREVVRRGDEGRIVVSYSPRGHAGRLYQRLFVYTPLSAERPTAILSLYGEVVASADRSDDYPYMRGALRLRQDTLRFGRGTSSERIACMNGGQSDLVLYADTLLTSQGVAMRCVPQRLRAGEEGYIEVMLSPQAKADTRPLRLYIGGLPLPPRQRVVAIERK